MFFSLFLVPVPTRGVGVWFRIDLAFFLALSRPLPVVRQVEFSIYDLWLNRVNLIDPFNWLHIFRVPKLTGVSVNRLIDNKKSINRLFFANDLPALLKREKTGGRLDSFSTHLRNVFKIMPNNLLLKGNSLMAWNANLY